MDKRFWMVYAVGGSSPKVRHETLESADKEAKRIANSEKGQVFVLEALHGYQPIANIEEIKFEEAAT